MMRCSMRLRVSLSCARSRFCPLWSATRAGRERDIGATLALRQRYARFFLSETGFGDIPCRISPIKIGPEEGRSNVRPSQFCTRFFAYLNTGKWTGMGKRYP